VTVLENSRGREADARAQAQKFVLLRRPVEKALTRGGETQNGQNSHPPFRCGALLGARGFDPLFAFKS